MLHEEASYQKGTTWTRAMTSAGSVFTASAHTWALRRDPACLLPSHTPIRAPTSSNGCLFSFFLSNLIISPPPSILRRWGRVLFCSSQIKPRIREYGWTHERGAGKSRPLRRGLRVSSILGFSGWVRTMPTVIEQPLVITMIGFSDLRCFRDQYTCNPGEATS